MPKQSDICRCLSISFAIIVTLMVAPATAQETPATAQQDTAKPINWRWWAEAGTEWFQWDEFLHGKREVREQGPRVALASGVDNLNNNAPGPLISLSGSFTFGQVDYDGTVQWQASPNGDEIKLISPAESTTNYRAFHLISEGGYRFGFSPRNTLELLGGIELDSWSRSLQNTSSIDIDSTQARDSEEAKGIDNIPSDQYPQGANGYTERYFLLALRASAGMTHSIAEKWQFNWRLGARYPFFIDEYDSGTGASLKPKGKISGFAETIISKRHSPWSLRVYFEEYLFGESDWQPAGFDQEVLAKQPRSESYRAGLAIRYKI